MANKGQAEFCCCTGCEATPTVWGEDGVDLQLGQLWQANCCACVPKYACVTIVGKGSTTLKLYCPPAPEGREQPLYKGSIYDGASSIIDIELRFDIVDGKCRFAFASYALGASGQEAGQYIIITQAIRSDFHFCQTLASTEFGYTEFSVGYDTIRVQRAAHTAIRGRHHCVDAYGNTIFDTNPIRDVCCSCACITRCMCLTVSGQGPASNKAEVACIQDLSAIMYGIPACNAYDREGFIEPQMGWMFPNIGATVSISPKLRPFKHETLIHCWPLDEASGVRDDLWGNAPLSEAGTVGMENSTRGGAAYKTAYAISENDYLSHHDEPGLRLEFDTTIALWVNVGRSDSYGWNESASGTILSKSGDFVASECEYALWYNSENKTLNLLMSNGVDIKQVTSDVLDFPEDILGNTPGISRLSEWRLVVIRRDALNGLFSMIVMSEGDVNSVTVPEYQPVKVYQESLSGTVLATEHPFRIFSRDYAYDPYGFTGRVDQVMMWAEYLNHTITNTPTVAPAVNCPWPTLFCDPSPNAYYSYCSDILSVFNAGLGRSCRADQNCYLSIGLDQDVFNTTTTPQDILINPITNPCPHPQARWEIMENPTVEVPYSHPLFFEVKEVGCEPNCVVNIYSCCEDGRTQFPRVLSADVATTCPDCPVAGVAMIWDSLMAQWVGRYTMCGHTAELRIGCGFKTLQFTGQPCVSQTATDSDAICTPILSQFSFSTSGIGCCGGSSLVNPGISVTVYE